MEGHEEPDPAPSKKLSSMAALTGTEEPELPPSQLDFGKPSRGRVAVFALMGLLATGAAVAGVGYYLHRSAMKAASLAFGDLNQCLIGEVNTTEAEVVIKYRRHQVAMMGRPADARSEGAGEAWPDRCASQAIKLVDAANDANLEASDGTSLRETAAELEKALKEGRALDNDISGLLTKTWAAAEKAGLRAPPSSVIGPPSHPIALTVGDLPDSAFVTKEYVALNDLQLPWHTSEEPSFYFDHKDGDGPFYCRAAPEQLVCTHIAATLRKRGHALRLLGSADPGVAPLLFAGNRGDAGIYRSDTGEEIDRMPSYGGYVSKGGLVVVAGYEGDKVILSVKKGKSAVRHDFDEELKRLFDEDPPSRGHAFYNVQVSHGFVYMRGVRKEQRRFWAFPLSGEGAMGKPIDLGELPEYGLVTAGDERPHIASCRTGEGRRVVRVHGRNHDYASFLADARWTNLVEADDLFTKRMECTESRALFMGDSFVEVCNSAGCKAERMRLEAPGVLSARAGTYGRAVLGDKVLAIWGAGARGGVRAKRGEPKELPTVQDSVLLDDLIDQGKISDLPTVTELRLIGGGAYALLLVQTKRGLSVLRIKADGSAMPETVQWVEAG